MAITRLLRRTAIIPVSHRFPRRQVTVRIPPIRRSRHRLPTAHGPPFHSSHRPLHTAPLPLIHIPPLRIIPAIITSTNIPPCQNNTIITIIDTVNIPWTTNHGIIILSNTKSNLILMNILSTISLSLRHWDGIEVKPPCARNITIFVHCRRSNRNISDGTLLLTFTTNDITDGQEHLYPYLGNHHYILKIDIRRLRKTDIDNHYDGKAWTIITILRLLRIHIYSLFVKRRP